MTKGAVLILGGASDIGMAVAHRFAGEGHPVRLALRRADTREPLRADIELRHQVEASLHEFDALAPDAMSKLLQELPDLPQVTICAVGVLGAQEVAEQDADHARLIADSNFTGPALALQLLAERLVAEGREAAIIGISSVAGDRGRASNFWYGAAKSAFSAILSGLRQKYSKTPLHVMTVKPGFVATRMTEGMDLPPALTASPDQVAEDIVRAWRKKRDVIYSKQIWRIVMLIIRLLPEFLFKRTRI